MALAAQHLPLIDAAHRGDRLAMEQLLHVCHPDIRRYAWRHCRAGDVDDAVQETLIILLKKLGTLKTLAAFSGWLFRIVRHECLRMGRKALSTQDEAQLDDRVAHLSPYEWRAELVEAMDALPEHYRQMILLRDFAEFSIREIADEVGLTAAAVKSRLHRARELMREYLTS
jgi:RNA polymerase sigma factor (sigma-70 family)